MYYTQPGADYDNDCQGDKEGRTGVVRTLSQMTVRITRCQNVWGGNAAAAAAAAAVESLIAFQ